MMNIGDTTNDRKFWGIRAYAFLKSRITNARIRSPGLRTGGEVWNLSLVRPMKTAFALPAKGEVYPIEKKASARIVRALCPELPLLAFHTMHGPKMSPGRPYLATYSFHYLRILSLRPEFLSDRLCATFSERVLPYLCGRIVQIRAVSFTWPLVVVAIEGGMYEVTCSAGGLFPSSEEIARYIKKHPRRICEAP